MMHARYVWIAVWTHVALLNECVRESRSMIITDFVFTFLNSEKMEFSIELKLCTAIISLTWPMFNPIGLVEDGLFTIYHRSDFQLAIVLSSLVCVWLEYPVYKWKMSSLIKCTLQFWWPDTVIQLLWGTVEFSKYFTLFLMFWITMFIWAWSSFEMFVLVTAELWLVAWYFLKRYGSTCHNNHKFQTRLTR